MKFIAKYGLFKNHYRCFSFKLIVLRLFIVDS